MYMWNGCLLTFIWEKEVKNSFSNIKPYKRRWREVQEMASSCRLRPQESGGNCFPPRLGQRHPLSRVLKLAFLPGSLPSKCRPLAWPQSPFSRPPSQQGPCHQPVLGPLPHHRIPRGLPVPSVARAPPGCVVPKNVNTPTTRWGRQAHSG